MAERTIGQCDVVCAGLIVGDLFVSPLEKFPAPGELVTTEQLVPGAGGCAVNTATTLATLGVSTALVAKVGSDPLGRQLRAEIEAVGVDVFAVSSSSTSATSQTIVVPVQGDDRRYIHSVGANAELTADDVAQATNDARVLVVGGFLALRSLSSEGLAGVFSRAQERGTRTVLDVVIPQGSVSPASQVKPVLPFVDCFLPNQDEARELTGEQEPAAQAAVLLSWGCASVVITSGAKGAYYADSNTAVRVFPLPIDFVDGSGAGDAFTAGIVVGLLEDWPLDQRLRFAAAVGASVCRGLGCNRTVFTKEEAVAALHAVPYMDAPKQSRTPTSSKD